VGGERRVTGETWGVCISKCAQEGGGRRWDYVPPVRGRRWWWRRRVGKTVRTAETRSRRGRAEPLDASRQQSSLSSESEWGEWGGEGGQVRWTPGRTTGWHATCTRPVEWRMFSMRVVAKFQAHTTHPYPQFHWNRLICYPGLIFLVHKVEIQCQKLRIFFELILQFNQSYSLGGGRCAHWWGTVSDFIINLSGTCWLSHLNMLTVIWTRCRLCACILEASVYSVYPVQETRSKIFVTPVSLPRSGDSGAIGKS
jgi:hypothetical protein